MFLRKYTSLDDLCISVICDYSDNYTPIWDRFKRTVLALQSRVVIYGQIDDTPEYNCICTNEYIFEVLFHMEDFDDHFHLPLIVSPEVLAFDNHLLSQVRSNWRILCYRIAQEKPRMIVVRNNRVSLDGVQEFCGLLPLVPNIAEVFAFDFELAFWDPLEDF